MDDGRRTEQSGDCSANYGPDEIQEAVIMSADLALSLESSKTWKAFRVYKSVPGLSEGRRKFVIMAVGLK